LRQARDRLLTHLEEEVALTEFAGAELAALTESGFESSASRFMEVRVMGQLEATAVVRWKGFGVVEPAWPGDSAPIRDLGQRR